jgi:heme-degrading monooxygenase HmoA
VKPGRSNQKNGVEMVIEYIRYKVPDERCAEFETAWGSAKAVLTDAPECIAHEVARGVEHPDQYIVRIEWTSLSDHEQGFRKSAGFGTFFAAVRPFFEQIQEMEHYDLTAVAGAAR